MDKQKQDEIEQRQLLGKYAKLRSDNQVLKDKFEKALKKIDILKEKNKGQDNTLNEQLKFLQQCTFIKKENKQLKEQNMALNDQIHQFEM